MIDASFLRAFGKVLFSVTAGEGELADEEIVLLTQEVEQTLTPLLRKQPNMMFWRPLFDFDRAFERQPDPLVAALVAALPKRPSAAHVTLRRACLELLTRMAASFGRGDQRTQALITALEAAWIAEP
jgi:type VI protein secretion system component VasK